MNPSPPASDSRSVVRLDRVAVTGVIVAGIVAALHVGKVPIAMPAMEQAFGRSLAALGWLVSVFAIVGAVGGTAIGLVVQRFGDRQMLVLGLVVLGLASIAGAWVADFNVLILSRVVEGLGFLTAVVAASAVLNRITPLARRGLVFGFWGSFMGIGIALSMWLGPLLDGWQSLWWVDGALALLMAVWVRVRIPPAAAGPPASPQGLGRLIRSRRPVLLALGFGVYNLQFFAMMSFLPSYLMQRVGLSVAQAGSAGALIVLANAVGNVAGGFGLQRGIREATLWSVAGAVCGILGILIFLPMTPTGAVIALGVGFSAVAGILPATFLATAPRAAPEAGLAPLSLGLVMQGNYIGQMVAPASAGALLAAYGWTAIGLQIGAAAVVVVALAIAFGRASG